MLSYTLRKKRWWIDLFLFFHEIFSFFDPYFALHIKKVMGVWFWPLVCSDSLSLSYLHLVMQQIQIWLQPQRWRLWQIYRIMMRWWCLMMSMNLSNYWFVLFLCFLHCITFSFFSYVVNTNLSHNTNLLQWVCLS